MVTEIIYNGAVIGTVDVGQSKILKCNGKKMTDDVTIKAGERTEIKYDGAVIATAKAGETKVIKCAGITLKSNIEVRVEDGKGGKDGISPTVEITTIEGGNRITITDVNGPKSTDIMDGKDGKSAYQYAQEGGYSGTEEEFCAKLAEESGEFEEIDPTVPDWAKQPEKPKYTADEVGALHKDTKIPAKTSDISNDSGFITRTVGDLANYYLKSETLTKTEINALVSAIPKFAIQVVNSLPTTDISTTTVYLLKSGIESDLYTEYIYVNGNWEILGSQRVDLTGYATENWVNIQLSAYLKSNELDSAINAALAQAKASGEFKGDKGDKGDPYKLTDADKAEIVQMVIESLGGNPVFGYVDENNNIIVSGNLADGSYSVKYEMEDGSKVNIGNLVLDTNVYYSITKNLTNCTISNSATQAAQGGSYSATITANDGYELKSVTVTMGGTNITSTVVSGGNINIASVTGNIVITAVAEEAVVEPSYTNVLPLSVKADNTPYIGDNGEDGYNTNKKISVSSGSESTASACVSGFIKLPEGVQSNIHIKNITVSSSASINNLVFYNASKEKTKGYAGVAGAFNSAVTVTNGVYLIKTSEWFTNDEIPVYFRFSCGEITEDTIVTINEEIV